jgi:hypothetical protein
MLDVQGVVRHPKFCELVEAISVHQPRTAEVIEGAIWEIGHNPKGSGVYINEIDVWLARVVMRHPPDLLLYYTIAPRFVMMLTVTTSDGSSLSS